jgi:hypothetical protein
MRISRHRSLWPLTAGGACIIAGVFLFVGLLTLTGCAVGFTDPGPDGKSEVVFGAGLGAVAKLANDWGQTARDFITSPDGLAAIASGGGIIGLVGYLGRRVARNGAAAAAAEAKRIGERDGWDEATAETDRRTAARDSDFYEAIALANGGVAIPVGNAVGNRVGKPGVGEVGA